MLLRLVTLVLLFRLDFARTGTYTLCSHHRHLGYFLFFSKLIATSIMPLAFATPPLSVTEAHQLAAFFSISYVGGLYVFKNARLSFASQPIPPSVDGREREKHQGERWRDDSAVIRARLLVVSVSTAVSCFALFVVIWNITGGLPEVRI